MKICSQIPCLVRPLTTLQVLITPQDDKLNQTKLPTTLYLNRVYPEVLNQMVKNFLTIFSSLRLCLDHGFAEVSTKRKEMTGKLKEQIPLLSFYFFVTFSFLSINPPARLWFKHSIKQFKQCSTAYKRWQNKKTKTPTHPRTQTQPSASESIVASRGKPRYVNAA